jgi:hypothetical protein
MDKEFTLEQLVMPGVIDHLIEASVWKATPVSDQPEIALQRWQVMQLPNGDRHFVGWNATERQGRASSKIVAFDAATRQGRTSSGRIYRLCGPTGRDGDGAHTWHRWMRVNDVAAFTDVSDEVQAFIDAVQVKGGNGESSK